MIRPLVISFLVMLVGIGMIILAFQKRPSKMTKVWWLSDSIEDRAYFDRFSTALVGFGFLVGGGVAFVGNLLNVFSPEH